MKKVIDDCQNLCRGMPTLATDISETSRSK